MSTATLPPAPAVIQVASSEEIPAGLSVDGQTQQEVAEGLFDALGSDDLEPEFALDETEEADGIDESDTEVEDDGESDEENEAEEDLGDYSEDESDDEQDEEAETEADLIEVTLPGGEKTKVTREEAAAGYSRTEDYTRKRQADVQEHTAVMLEANGLRDKFAAGLEKMDAMLRENGPSKPGPELRVSNPGEYAAQLAEYGAHEESLKQVADTRAGIQAEQAQEQSAIYNEHVSAQWQKVVEAVPEWQDEKVSSGALKELRTFAIAEHGFSEQEIDSLADARVLLMLKENHDLRSTRDSTAKKVTKRKAKSARLNPGGSNPKGATKRSAKKTRQAADQRAATSGSVKDAAAAIELLLD